MPFDDTTGITTTPVIQLLEKARWRLRKPQLWCKDRMDNGNRVCMLGSIEYAVNHSAYPVTTVTQARAGGALCKIIGDQGISDFNDRSTTKHKDVLAVFDKAILNERAKVR